MLVSQRMKRGLFLVGFLCVVAAGSVAFFAYQLTRDVPFDWEHANIIEAHLAKSKLRFYDEAVKNGEKGYVRLSQVEINSYMRFFLTNSLTNAVEGPTHLRRAGISMTKTNLSLFSWAETKVAGWPVRFVVEREFNMRQGGQQWDFSPNLIRIGNLEISRAYWPRLENTMAMLDRPLVDYFGWVTNIKALIATKNELSQRPELRLYNYDPFTEGR